MNSKCAAAVLAACLVYSVHAQQLAVKPDTVHVTALEFVAEVRDAQGKVPAGMTPADFIVLEDGIERKVVGVDPLRVDLRSDTPEVRTAASATAGASASPAKATGGRPTARLWQTVLYFDAQFAHPQARKGVARRLADQVKRLVQMGTVDVVIADPVPVALVRGSRDANQVIAALKLIETTPGQNWLYFHRNSFLEQARTGDMLDQRRQTSVIPPPPPEADLPPTPGGFEAGKKGQQTAAPAFGANPGADQYTRRLDWKSVQPYVEEELASISRFRRHLLAWTGTYRRHSPRALLLISNGYDLDPLEFYGATLDKNEQMGLRQLVPQSAATPMTEQFARTLGAAGWTVLTFPGDANPERWIEDASVSGGGRIITTPTRNMQAGPKAIFYRPLDPFHLTAAETGGAVVVDGGKIGQAIDRLNDRVVITYQVDRKADDKARKVELKARNPEWKIQSARWASSSTAQEVAESRAVRLLMSDIPGADFTVIAETAWEDPAATRKGTIDVLTSIEALSKVIGATEGNFRVTFAVYQPPSQVNVRSQLVPGYKLASGKFEFSAPLNVSNDATRIVVVVEETGTGMWGSATIDL